MACRHCDVKSLIEYRALKSSLPPREQSISVKDAWFTVRVFRFRLYMGREGFVYGSSGRVKSSNYHETLWLLGVRLPTKLAPLNLKLAYHAKSPNYCHHYRACTNGAHDLSGSYHCLSLHRFCKWVK